MPFTITGLMMQLAHLRGCRPREPNETRMRAEGGRKSASRRTRDLKAFSGTSSAPPKGGLHGGQSRTIPVVHLETALADLKARLAMTRFPDQAPDGPWAYDSDLEYMRSLVGYWNDSFDWRAQEAALNAYP